MKQWREATPSSKGIHWLHLAASLGPRITRIEGFRPAPAVGGTDRRAKSMMVAFEYDNGAVGSILRARSRHSSRDCDCRSFSDARASSRSNRTVCSSWSAAQGSRESCFPAFRDIRGYQAMYRDFHRSIHEGRSPAMSLESNGGPASHGSDLRSLTGDRPARGSPVGVRCPMQNESYDIIIIGTGAGGGTIAQALAGAAPDTHRRARHIRASRGGELEPGCRLEGSRYRTTEHWVDERGGRFFRIRTTASAATPSSGAACSIASVARTFRPSSMLTAPRRRGRSTTTRWSRTTSGPSGCITCTARTGSIRPSRPITRHPPINRSRTPGRWKRSSRVAGTGASSVTAAARSHQARRSRRCVLCNTCNSFPCRVQAKSDADVLCVRPAVGKPTVTLWTGAFAADS